MSKTYDKHWNKWRNRSKEYLEVKKAKRNDDANSNRKVVEADTKRANPEICNRGKNVKAERQNKEGEMTRWDHASARAKAVKSAELKKV